MKNETLSLLKRAEEFLKKYPEAIKEITTEDVNKLVEDLHIYQIELEIQNEELRRAQSELEVSRTQFHAQLECILIKDTKGNITQTRTAISDISERKRGEEVLRNAHVELERRVEKRTVEFVKANEELEAVLEDRKRVELELREALSEVKRLNDQLKAERTYLQARVFHAMKVKNPSKRKHHAKEPCIQNYRAITGRGR